MRQALFVGYFGVFDIIAMNENNKDPSYFFHYKLTFFYNIMGDFK